MASISISGQVQQELALDKLNEQFLLKDTILNFFDLMNKFDKIYLPDDCILIYWYEITSNCLIFHLLLHNNDICVAPKLLASVVVHDELKINAFASQAALPMHICSHLLTNGSVASLSDLSNILVLCKSIAENTFVSTQKCCLIDVALSALSQCLSLLEAADEDRAYCTLLLHFICDEQLQLLQMPKYGRRYSANLITLYFLWQLTSSALYKKLHDTLILPSISRLCQYSFGMSVETSSLDLSYLTAKTKDLLQECCIMVLMIDKVYTAQSIEYSNGNFVGLTEKGK